MKTFGKRGYTRLNYFQDHLADGKPNNWRCRAGARYLYICEDGLVHYCSQQRGYPAIPLEKYTVEDIRREYRTDKGLRRLLHHRLRAPGRHVRFLARPAKRFRQRQGAGRSRPRHPDALSDRLVFPELGSPSIEINTLETLNILGNPDVYTDGTALLATGFFAKLWIWKSLPQTSGQAPDVKMDLDFGPVGLGLHDGKPVVGRCWAGQMQGTKSPCGIPTPEWRSAIDSARWRRSHLGVRVGQQTAGS